MMHWLKQGVNEWCSDEMSLMMDGSVKGLRCNWVLSALRQMCAANKKSPDDLNFTRTTVAILSSKLRISKKFIKESLEILQNFGFISLKNENSYVEISTREFTINKSDYDYTGAKRQKDLRERIKLANNVCNSQLNEPIVTVKVTGDTDKEKDKEKELIHTEIKKEEVVFSSSVFSSSSCLSKEELKAEAIKQIMANEQFNSVDSRDYEVYADSMVKFMTNSKAGTLDGKSKALNATLKKNVWGLTKEESARLVSNTNKVQPNTAEMPLNRIPPTSKEWPLEDRIIDSENSYNHFLKIGNKALADFEKKNLDSLLAQKSKVA